MTYPYFDYTQVSARSEVPRPPHLREDVQQRLRLGVFARQPPVILHDGRALIPQLVPVGGQVCRSAAVERVAMFRLLEPEAQSTFRLVGIENVMLAYSASGKPSGRNRRSAWSGSKIAFKSNMAPPALPLEAWKQAVTATKSITSASSALFLRNLDATAASPSGVASRLFTTRSLDTELLSEKSLRRCPHASNQNAREEVFGQRQQRRIGRRSLIVRVGHLPDRRPLPFSFLHQL